MLPIKVVPNFFTESCSNYLKIRLHLGLDRFLKNHSPTGEAPLIFRISEKMQILNRLIVLASTTFAQDGADSNTNCTTSIGEIGLERQYTDLLKLVRHYSPDFDERKYWAYGCNCLLLGNRPMSGQGFGQPVDAVDLQTVQS